MLQHRLHLLWPSRWAKYFESAAHACHLAGHSCHAEHLDSEQTKLFEFYVFWWKCWGNRYLNVKRKVLGTVSVHILRQTENKYLAASVKTTYTEPHGLYVNLLPDYRGQIMSPKCCIFVFYFEHLIMEKSTAWVIPNVMYHRLSPIQDERKMQGQTYK